MTSATPTARSGSSSCGRLWREQSPVDFHGRYFESNNLIGEPKPFAGSEPVLMNAGYSPAGRSFAMRNCEFLLTSLIDLDSGRHDVETVQAAARQAARP